MIAAGKGGLVSPGQPGASAEEGGVLGLTFLAALGGVSRVSLLVGQPAVE